MDTPPDAPTVTKSGSMNRLLASHTGLSVIKQPPASPSLDCEGLNRGGLSLIAETRSRAD